MSNYDAGRCRREIDSHNRLESHHAAIADAIDRIAADVAEIKSKVDAVAPDDVRHFVESEKEWVKLVEEQRDAAIRERDEARALLKLAQVQRTVAYADRDEARANVYQLKCSRTETSKERDAAIRERDEARAEVERLKAELAARPPDGNCPKTLDSSPAATQPAAQPAAPPPGWLTEEERELLQSRSHALRVYLRTLCKPYPGSITREVEIIEAIISRAGSPPVVEVPAISRRDVPMQNEALAYRDAMDKAGVPWKEVGRE